MSVKRREQIKEISKRLFVVLELMLLRLFLKCVCVAYMQTRERLRNAHQGAVREAHATADVEHFNEAARTTQRHHIVVHQ